MKHLLMILVCACCAFTSLNAQDAKKNKKETVTFTVPEMDCQNCVKKIEKNIPFEKGVTDLKCDLKSRTATVTFRTDKTSEQNLESAFKKLGLETTKEKVEEHKCDGNHSHGGHKH